MQETSMKIRCMIENTTSNIIVSDWKEQDIYFSDWIHNNTCKIGYNKFMEYYINKKNKSLMLSFVR